MSVKHKTIRCISSKLFFELWQLANEEQELKEYYGKVMGKININTTLRKLDIPYENFLDMLQNIYKAAQTDINDIVAKSNLSRAEFGYYFGIPKRTIENWCYGKRECPQYIKLMFLRHYKMINLGHHIYIDIDSPKIRAAKREEKNREVIPDKKNDSFKSWEDNHIFYGDKSTEKLLGKLEHLKR